MTYTKVGRILSLKKKSDGTSAKSKVNQTIQMKNGYVLLLLLLARLLQAFPPSLTSKQGATRP